MNSAVNPFWQEKYRRECGKNWNLFYRRNKDKFFKDRHWVNREFPELNAAKSILEVGCGVGNFILPHLEENKQVEKAFACDLSETAVSILNKKCSDDDQRLTAFVADITQTIPKLSTQVDIVTMIFVLSAIPPEKFHLAISNVAECLRPGGLLLFRDYAVDDAAKARFKEDRKLDENLFVRQDGTLAYYFGEVEVTKIFKVHFECASCETVLSRTSNVKRQIELERRFIQAKFIKK
jgi:methyltransferase-like protein 6